LGNRCLVIYEKFSSWYFKNYRKLLVIPLVVFLASALLFYDNKVKTGEFFPKDIDLSGGTVITVYTNETSEEIKETFTLQGLSFREIKKYNSHELIAVAIEAGPEFEEQELVDLIDQTFPGLERDIRNVGPAMGESFMRSASKAVFIGFVLMGVILAVIFRQPIVAFTVILSGFLNVFEAAALMTRFGVKLAPHTIGALLMLMGWSVDSEVLFDTKILKNVGGDPKKRAMLAMKTAMTMSAAIFAALFALYFFSTSILIKDIALVLILGAFFDIINTWFQSLSMVLWYAEAKK